MQTISGRLKIFVLSALVALLSGGAGFYIGFGKGANTMATLASQNAASDALSDVRRSVAALQEADPAQVRRKVATDLRIALFSLDAYSSAVPFVKCDDQDRKALEKAASYIAANPDPKIFNSDPELGRGLRFCESR
ncbi:hypothetical protein ABQJ54_13965 [Rhodanobacter sp. Si-c]|uniref:Uncharacterized protein n=1 Tax=Rhodanobacter lycopersici TaxID=3162487 RepID=A0ABV3QHD1_9GAMM